MKKLLSKRFDAAVGVFGPKARTYSKNVHIEGMSDEDVYQELMIELVKACEDYDPQKGAKFNSFVQTYWKNRISKLKRASKTIGRGRNYTTINLDDDSLRGLAAPETQSKLGNLAATLKTLELTREEVLICIALSMKMELQDIPQCFDNMTRVEVDEIIHKLRHSWDFYRNIKSLARTG